VFQQLSPGLLTSDSETDFAAALDTVRDLIGRVYTATIEAIDEEYSTNYLASLFKNGSRCKDVASQVAAPIAESAHEDEASPSQRQRFQLE
jgi:hypothetical protein